MSNKKFLGRKPGPKYNTIIYSSGLNNYGQLGLGDTDNRNELTQVPLSGNWNAVYAGGRDTSPITSAVNNINGLYTCGRGDRGVFGNSDFNNISYPNLVNVHHVLGEITDIKYGNNFAIILAGGKLYSCGQNNIGQLGLGDNTDRNTFTQIGSESNWTMITVSMHGVHALALNSDGELYGWGDNANGQLGLGDNTNRNAPTRVGTKKWSYVACGPNVTYALDDIGLYHACGLGTNGRLGLGDNVTRNILTPSPENHHFNYVSGGDTCGFGIKEGGTGLFAWGRNNKGQLGFGNTTSTNTITHNPAQWTAVKVISASDSTIMLDTEGRIWSTGNNEFGQLGSGNNNDRNTFNRIGYDNDWIDIAAGNGHIVALKRQLIE